jgi:hypothetical protein
MPIRVIPVRPQFVNSQYIFTHNKKPSYVFAVSYNIFAS